MLALHGAYFRMDAFLYLKLYACKVFEKTGLETSRIPCKTLSLALFLLNLGNRKSAFIKILSVLANVCVTHQFAPSCSSAGKDFLEERME